MTPREILIEFAGRAMQGMISATFIDGFKNGIPVADVKKFVASGSFDQADAMMAELKRREEKEREAVGERTIRACRECEYGNKRTPTEPPCKACFATEGCPNWESRK